MRPCKRDLNLRKILQGAVHVLLLHLHGEYDEDDGEYGEHGEDDGEYGEDDEDVHVLILCLTDEGVVGMR